MANGNGDEASFIRRTLIALGIAATLIVIGLVAVLGVRVLLLGFAGVLLAVFLHALASGLAKSTRMPHGWSLSVVCMLLLALVIGGGTLLLPDLTDQIDQLGKRLPESLAALERWLSGTTWGRWLVAEAKGGTQGADPGSALLRAAGFLSTTIGNLANVLITLFIGIYLAAQPGLYLEGIVRLHPIPRRQRARETLGEMGYELRWWLIGQLVAMMLIGTLVTIGLWLMGIPLALLLGILAGLLNFIPNFGPIISAVPAMLLALTISPVMAMWVAALYFAVQSFETYLITPMIQQSTVRLPPALTIISQVLMGVTAGPIGVALATPLVVVVLVLVKLLYVEDALGDRVDIPGRDQARSPDWKLT